MNRLNCPCCGYYTIDSNDEVIVDICEVCYWQYDIVAQNHPNLVIGPNKTSLTEAKLNYQKFGVSNTAFQFLVRFPYEEELPENN